MAPPVPDFLSLNGTPDPRRPGPPVPESQLPPIPHIPGSPGTPEILDSVQTKNPPQKGTPGLRPQGFVNFPGAENGAGEIENAIRVLAQANIPVPLPGGLMAAPNQEMDEDFQAQPEVFQTFLRVLEKSGRVTKAAEVAGMPRSSFYSRKRDDEVFAKLWSRALKYRAELLEDEAIRRAVTGVKEDVYYMGAVCGRKTNYSDALLAKLLEGNMPEKYRQNHKIELEGKMAVATLVLPAATTAEEWAAQNSGTIIEQEPEDEYAS